MTAIHGIITEIKNGTLLLSSGVRIRVPSTLLRKLREGQTVTLCVAQVGNRSARQLFGFPTPEDRTRFLAFLELDDSDPVGTLAMVAAGKEPVDIGADNVLVLMKEALPWLDATEEEARRAIAQTDWKDTDFRRSTEAITILAKAKDKAVEVQ